MHAVMNSARRLSDRDLISKITELVHTERNSAADVIEHLVEIDRRRLHLNQACSSLTAYCIERLGYSEDESSKRVRIARLAGRFPQVLDELRTAAIHMTGLIMLAPYLDEANFDELVPRARHQSKAT